MADVELRRGQQLLGTLTQTGTDQPWYLGVFEPTEAFDEVRPLFQQELELLEADRIDDMDWLWDRIVAMGIVLVPVATGQPIKDFLLHIDGTDAWWRY